MKGFENDPFEKFYPSGYQSHMTGRTRSLPRDLPLVLPSIKTLVNEVIGETRTRGFDLYAEVEIVHENSRFSSDEPRNLERSLDRMTFRRSGRIGGARADVHVKFQKETVPEAVRAYLIAKEFYWVSIPETQKCFEKEVATLQTSRFGGAKKAFDLLVTSPPPGCIGLQLEQKLLMEATSPSIPMPEIIEVA